jgi:hypothetical protein
VTGDTDTDIKKLYQMLIILETNNTKL